MGFEKFDIKIQFCSLMLRTQPTQPCRGAYATISSSQMFLILSNSCVRNFLWCVRNFTKSLDRELTLRSCVRNSALTPELRSQQRLRSPLCVFKHAETRFQLFILHFPPSETTILSSPNPSTHSPLSLIFIIIIVHHHHPQMASKGKGVARQPSIRTPGTSSCRQASQEAERFETPAHAERGEILTERKVMDERVINFRGKRDTFQEQILARGWEFMYDLVIPVNMTLVHEFYANRDQKNQREAYIRGRKIPCHLGNIEGVLHIPRFRGVSEHNAVGEKYDNDDLDMNEVMRVIRKDGATWPDVPGRVNKNILNKDTWMWKKLVVCNILPTRHETTLGADHILLIYALLKGMTVSLPGVMVAAKSKRQLLPFPMFITKWAAQAGVPTYPGDEIFNIPKAHQFFPYGLWKKGEEVERDPAPPAPAPAPVPPPAARTSTPASSRSNLSQPSRNELLRALRRNECVMRRHEQLLLMLHPDIHTSQLQQISSPDVSEQQQQAANDSEDEDSSEEDGSDEDSSEE
ncbi:hypothetical protein PIB30_089152 [Stylosanthes scabra]|uniref:Putative plant transposon protein domain-containing protein n=1 Tax=Stylosanthes scabra TaxID=79078 RepID=A0ABU6RTV0_9FABA|nr:hypothetical protein [Stylosanthes scabra]